MNGQEGMKAVQAPPPSSELREFIDNFSKAVSITHELTCKITDKVYTLKNMCVPTDPKEDAPDPCGYIEELVYHYRRLNEVNAKLETLIQNADVLL